MFGRCLKEKIRQDFLSCLSVAQGRSHLFTSVMLIETPETLPEKSMHPHKYKLPSLPCLPLSEPPDPSPKLGKPLKKYMGRVDQ